VAKVKNVDDRKRRMTLRDVLTMTAGLAWRESDVAYDDPRSDSSLMEATEDWVQYVIDKPMAEEPGKVFNYSSGVRITGAFLKETGQDIDIWRKISVSTVDRALWKRTHWSGGHRGRAVSERRGSGENRVFVFARRSVGRQTDRK
jgi:hypothetical protein